MGGYDPEGSIREVEAQLQHQHQEYQELNGCSTLSNGEVAIVDPGGGDLEAGGSGMFGAPLTFSHVGNVPVITDVASININLPVPPNSDRGGRTLSALTLTEGNLIDENQQTEGRTRFRRY